MAEDVGGTRGGLSLGKFVAELQRRRVFRALVTYAVAAVIVLRAADSAAQAARLPEWVLAVVVVLLGLGFPLTVGLAWAFDLTTSGVQRTADGGAAGLAVPRGTRLVLLLGGLAALAAAPGLAYHFLWLGRGARTAGDASEPAPAGEPSIAVLPFASLSSDRENEYFSDGIAEEILNALAQVPGLRVIGRTSSFATKGRNEDLRAIGRSLHTSNLLEGSVRKAGSRVRITAQLVETRGGSHLWSREFDRELTDVFAVQEEIAQAVVAALKLKLLPPAAEERRAVVPEAHEQFLLGVALMARGSGESYARAADVLERAVKLDPRQARAWALFATALYWAADQGGGRYQPARDWPRAMAAAERAVALAPEEAVGYYARGLLKAYSRQDWRGAAVDLERARSLAPQSPGILLTYSTLLSTLGRAEEAVPVAEKAADLDPLSADGALGQNMAFLATGRFAQAEGAARRALEIAPQNGRAARNLGFSLLLQGKVPEARAAFARSSNPTFRAVGEIMVLHAMGDEAGARRQLEELARQPGVEGASYQLAETFAWRGDAEGAFRWLDRAVELHDAGLSYLKTDPLLAPLRADPRYRRLLERLRLPADAAP